MQAQFYAKLINCKSQQLPSEEQKETQNKAQLSKTKHLDENKDDYVYHDILQAGAKKQINAYTLNWLDHLQ